MGAFVYPGTATGAQLITDVNGEVYWDTDLQGNPMTGTYRVALGIVTWYQGMVRACNGPMLIEAGGYYDINLSRPL